MFVRIYFLNGINPVVYKSLKKSAIKCDELQNMSSEKERLLELLFPEEDRSKTYFKFLYYLNCYEYLGELAANKHFDEYLTKLGSLKLDDVLKEPAKLQDERASILQHTQDLTVTNYKTFIQTAECSRNLLENFNNTECKADELLENIPKFEHKLCSFANDSNGINEMRRLNMLTLDKSPQLQEILELPQLMGSFIKDGLFEEALELAGYVRRLNGKHTDIRIFKVTFAKLFRWLYTKLIAFVEYS